MAETSKGMFSIQQEKGWQAALQNTGDELLMKNGKEFPFAKSAVALGGVLALGHGVFVDKDADGEDRSFIVRVLETVIGGAAIAGAALAGR